MKESLFDLPRPERGMRAGSLKNLGEIYQFVRPWLLQTGYEIESFHDIKFTKQLLAQANEENWSPLYKRFLTNRSGNLKIIYPQDVPEKRIIVQVLVIDRPTVECLENRPRFNIPKELLELSTKEDRVEKTWNFLNTINVHFLVWTKTGWFWMGKFSDIPIEGYGLTYRRDRNKLNRLYTLPEYQIKRFHRRTELQQEVITRINALV